MLTLAAFVKAVGVGCVVSACAQQPQTQEHGVVVASTAQAPSSGPDEALAALWDVALKVGQDNLSEATVSSFGFEVALPEKPTSEMRQGGIQRFWVFRGPDVSATHPYLIGARYEKAERFQVRTNFHLSIGMNRSKLCVTQADVETFLLAKGIPRSEFRYAWLSRAMDPLHRDYQEQKRRGDGIYSVGAPLPASQAQTTQFVAGFMFRYYQCLSGVEVMGPFQKPEARP